MNPFNGSNSPDSPYQQWARTPKHTRRTVALSYMMIMVLVLLLTPVPELLIILLPALIAVYFFFEYVIETSQVPQNPTHFRLRIKEDIDATFEADWDGRDDLKNAPLHFAITDEPEPSRRDLWADPKVVDWPPEEEKS